MTAPPALGGWVWRHRDECALCTKECARASVTQFRSNPQTFSVSYGQASDMGCARLSSRARGARYVTPKVLEICCAMRIQPKRALRRFISTMAAMSSVEGPLGPGLRCRDEEEKSRWYFRSTKALWNLSSVAGLTSAPSFGTRRGLTTSVINRPCTGTGTGRAALLRGLQVLTEILDPIADAFEELPDLVGT